MKAPTKIHIAALILAFFSILPGWSQGRIIAKSDSKGSYRGGDFLKGNVRIRQGTTIIYCDSAYFIKEANMLELHRRVRILDGDSVTITAARAKYNTKGGIIELRGNVVYKQLGRVTLFTNFLDYDRNRGYARYFNGGKLVDSTSVLTSQRGYFDKPNNLTSFGGNVKGTNPEWSMESDTLQYNSLTRIVHFLKPTKVVNNQGNVSEYETGTYNTFSKQSTLRDGKFETESFIVIAETIVMNEATKSYSARGKVFMQSKTDDTIVTGEHAIFDQANGLTKVYENALMKKPAGGGDTLFLKADTLISIDPDPEDETKKRLLAYFNVKVYKNDFQGKADSLAYVNADSTINFYGDPVLWALGTQLTADTLSLVTANNAIQQLKLLTNGYIITQDTLFNFNQIKGRHITTYFRENKIHKIDVQGNGESLYYVLEENDSKVTGINMVTCANMLVRFQDGLLKTIRFDMKPEGKFYPPHLITTKESQLKGFDWRFDEKPKKEELFIAAPPAPSASATPERSE
ncbi:MAG: Organic solvent tolerance protein OstA [Cyclobacteriaceae bacterium]|nr:Organic solvent tolerance protein OstA [Cyclobacteriaceae bacterium]